MTKENFLQKTPSYIEHNTWGFSILKIRDIPAKKSAWYLNENNLSSYGAHGQTWQEVYTQINKTLKENNHLK